MNHQNNLMPFIYQKILACDIITVSKVLKVSLVEADTKLVRRLNGIPYQAYFKSSGSHCVISNSFKYGETWLLRNFNFYIKAQSKSSLRECTFLVAPIIVTVIISQKLKILKFQVARLPKGDTLIKSGKCIFGDLIRISWWNASALVQLDSGMTFESRGVKQ